MSEPGHPHVHVHISSRRVLVAGACTILAALGELVVSRYAGSLFLVADAVHLVAHLGIFLVLLLPVRGHHDAREDGATVAVLLVVLAVAAGVLWESARGLTGERELPSPALMLASLLGLAANLVSAWLFRDPAHTRWSFRAALAHELSDASMTVAGLVGAAMIALFKLRWIDPALSLVIAVWLGAWALWLLGRRVRLGPAAWAQERQEH